MGDEKNSSAAPQDPGSDSVPAGGTPPSAGNAPPEADFLQFISGMAIQTLMHLGAMTNPVTNQKDLDLANAKYSIDLLRILREKTKGNLTAEEDRYFAAALRDLQLNYVRVIEIKENPPQSPPPSED